MRMDGIRAAVVVGILLVVAVPGTGWADGGFFVDTSASTTQAEAANQGLLASSGQRAVLWQSSEDCWDLYVEPGTVQLESAAWVVPLPVVPEVSEASAGFIDQLDAATVPVFHTSREVLRFTEGGNGGGCGCIGADEGGAGAEPGGEETLSEVAEVTVWGQGRLGGLTYDVVSSADASALESWLSDHGYAVPDALDSSLEPYVEDGFVFFAAQVDREAEAATAISVVKFELCDTPGAMVYPVRLSTYSIAESFDLTLWLVDPVAYAAPTDCPWQAPGDFYEPYLSIDNQEDYAAHREEIETPFAERYAARIDEILDSQSDRAMAVQYAAQIRQSELATRLGLLAESGASPPLTTDGADWTPELSSIIEGGLVVTRWVGRMTVAGMDDDLHFRPTVLLDEDAAIYNRTFTFWNFTPPGLEGDEGGDLPDAFGATDGRAAFRSAGVALGGPRSTRSPWLLGVVGAVSALWLRRRRGRGSA